MCNIQTTESLHGFEKVFTNMHCKNISVKNIIQSTDTDFTFLDSHHIWFSQMKIKVHKSEHIADQRWSY